jgi:hypothetical protein
VTTKWPSTTWPEHLTTPRGVMGLGSRLGAGWPPAVPPERRRLTDARHAVRARLWKDLAPYDSAPGRFAGPALTGDSSVDSAHAPELWLEERRFIQRLQGQLGEQLDDLLLAERAVGSGWGDVVTQIAPTTPADLSDAARYAKLAVRDLPSRRNIAPDAGGLGRPTPFEVSNELLLFLNALHEEGALLDDTECQDMLLGTAGGETSGILGLTHEQIVVIADEILSSRRWDEAYQRGVCAYLLALDAALVTADTLTAWVDTWGGDEVRDEPDWFKLLIVHDI